MASLRGYVLVFGLAWLMVAGCSSDGEKQVQQVLVTSPSGALALEVVTDDDGRLTYTVLRNGEMLIEESPLGLVASTHDLSGGVTMSSAAPRAIDESYTMLT